MDPDEVLKKLREAVDKFEQEADPDGGANPAMDAAADIALRFAVLDEWLSKGGFLPRAWRH